MKRAYSSLTIKAFDDDERVIEGVATTPATDRMGDVVQPDGAEFQLPIPLLWQHDSRQPIGHVFEAKVTSAGITIKARLVKIDEPGPLKDRLDEAWQSLKSGLVRGLSIGFKSLESARIGDTWHEHFLKWLWLELSAVTIPANQDASITAIKSIDTQLRAASGEKQRVVVRLTDPGASGSRKPLPKGIQDMNIAEQIKALENKRAASVAAREAIQAKATDAGRTKDATEKEEFDTLSGEIKAIDDELADLKVLEKEAVAKARTIPAVPGVETPAAGGTVELKGTSLSVRPNVEKGIPMTRYVKAMINGMGNPQLALMYAQGQRSWLEQTPQVIEVLKTAVAGGTTTSSGWASQLVYNQDLVGEFIELLRPLTIIGKMTGLTRVPFNVRMSGQDSGSTAYWVGQGKAIPVSKLNTTEVTLGMAKAAGLVVLTEELVRSSEPSAELLVRNDLLKTISQFCDVQFVDPNVAVSANVSPASITNGVTATAPTGTTAAHLRADVQTLFRAFIAANDDPTSCVWIMDPVTALAISLMRTSLDQPEFPGLTMQGGTFFGLPVVVSNSANITGSPDSGHMLILAKSSDILFADDGGLEIDASREASVEMTDTPTGDAAAGTAGTTSLVSMFQTKSVAVRAVRFINWKKRRSTAVSYIREANYVA